MAWKVIKFSEIGIHCIKKRLLAVINVQKVSYSKYCIGEKAEKEVYKGDRKIIIVPFIIILHQYQDTGFVSAQI